MNTTTDSASVASDLARSLAGGNLEVVDLTSPLSSSTPTLELPDPFVNLIDFSIDYQAEYDDRGPFWKHANIHTGEHIGTHIDAPVHWISGKDGKDVSQIEPSRLIGPAVVLDFSAQAANDPDYLISISDIKTWEKDNGDFPDNCWVLVRTGWDSRGHDRQEFLNKYDGGSHTPGFTADCALWLAERPEISGVGVETVGIDAGGAADLEPAFPMHYHLLGHDKYGITSLKNLTKLPRWGAVVVVAPLPIAGGTGAPARVFALVDGAGEEGR